MTRPRWRLGLFMLSGILAVAEGKPAVIEERQAMMRALGNDLQKIWDGLYRGEKEMIVGGAQHIAAEASRILVLFPPDSFHPPSRARPDLRREFSAFETFTEDLKKAAETLATTAQRGSLADVRPHLTRLVRSCRQCHRSYVQPY